MTIKGILLAGAALCTVSIAPALASNAPKFSVAALRTGGIVKTAMRTPKASAVTYTFSVTTAISTKADYMVKTNLAGTFYTWLSNDSICQQPKKETVTLSTAQTVYALLSTGVESYSEGCGKPTFFYGDVYDLQTKKAKNKTDKFTSTLKATFKNSGKFKGSLNIDVSVEIGK
jgi:hypothetical protein